MKAWTLIQRQGKGTLTNQFTALLTIELSLHLFLELFMRLVSMMIYSEIILLNQSSRSEMVETVNGENSKLL